MLNSCVLYGNKWQHGGRRCPSEHKASTPTPHIQDAITGSSAVSLPLTDGLTARSAWLAAAALVAVPSEQRGSELGAVGAFLSRPLPPISRQPRLDEPTPYGRELGRAGAVLHQTVPATHGCGAGTDLCSFKELLGIHSRRGSLCCRSLGDAFINPMQRSALGLLWTRAVRV